MYSKLIIVLFFTLTIAYDDLTCVNSECDCFNGETYQCPAKTMDISINVYKTPLWKLEMDCTNKLNYYNVSYLPKLNVPNVKIFDIKNCPIPSSSFADLLSDYFNITQLEFLFVTAPSTNNFILTKEHFANLSTIKILTFNSPFLSYENNFLEYLPNITRLYLNNNNFQNVNINFNYTPSLVYLDLSRNKLDNLNSNWFYGLENLKILHLFGNRFTELNRDMFSGLNALQSLELSNNKIKFIKEDTFYDLIKLKNLSLLTNQLEFLPRNLLKNNQQLEGVRLGFNPKLRLDDYLLANLTNLKTVTLSYSNLETIPEHLFNGDENLVEILLDHNKLETLPVGVFSALKKLTLLSLNKNQIKHLPDEVFNSLSKLEKLDLSNNLLTNITANLFTSLINLKYLLLERNAINFIDINAFKELRNVIYLNLAHNQYTMDDYPAELHPFTSLLNIEELDLSYNMITTVNSNMIFLYPNIKRLNLSHNYVDSLAVETICPSSKYVLTLDLSYNNISWFDMKNFDVILPEYGKTILNLTNNPFNCDCFNYHFLRYLQQDQIKTIEIVQSNMFKCNLPKQLENNHFKTLKLSSLLCELNTNYKGCPETCKCYLRTFDKALIIDCAYKNLTKLPKFKVQSFTNQTVLNLIGNFIENIPEFTENLKEYKNVTVLYLNDNRLKDLAWLPPNLTEVHLDGNKLSHLRHNIITEMKNSTTLQTVTLKNNPWTCDCSNFHFQRFLQFNPKVDANKIFCANTTDLVHHIKDICPSYLIIYLTIGFATVLFFVILIALYYRYEQEIKVWLYAKNILLWLVTEEELDKDKQFDVFVSYSHKDEKFVVEKLMPELESGPNPYSVCVHYRNWVPGEFIATQLTNSVLNSRRTLVVLSNNFVDSIWGKMEFRTAHMEAIREGRARVIVLIYGDLNEDMLDEELKVYLKTNTYVKWGDPYFWNKLKYALPHRKLMKNQQKLQNIMLKIDDKFELNENPVNCANKLQTPPAEA